MCGSIEVDVWRARIGLFAARIASRLPKRWRKIKKQVASMLFTHGVFAGGGACSLGCVSNFGRKRETRLLAVLMSLLLATSVMNVSLLLRCGDIETNPGPGRYPDLDYDSVDCSKLLGEDDLHDIMTEIITAKARFYAIGRALGLPPGELSSVRSSNTQDHELQLNDVLLVWLRQKYNVERFGSPTWQKLVEVIDNPAGGNDHRLAKAIALRHPIVTVSEFGYGYGCEGGRGQWQGHEHGSRGLGTCTPLEGAVDNQQREPPQNESKFEYRQTLNNFYLRQIDDQAWPPVKVTDFINLALIKGLKSWHKTVQESVDEIVGEKKDIPYQHIFEDLDQLKFILFEGRPGSGKTTLMTKISRDWANGQFLKSKLLFFIPLRRLNTFCERSLATLIQVACPPFKQDEVESLVGAVQVMNGKNVVFIFDGFDEYSPASSSSDIVLSLMNCYRSYLRDAVIVVSSRPAACYEYRQYADKEIEVVGFLKEHISQYIRHYYSNDAGKAQQLLEHLEQHPNLMNMCYLPLHCAMLVFLYDGTAVLPKTETEFYKHFTISTLLRSFRKVSGSFTCLTSFSQLPSKDKILFDKVCKLAFEATIAQKQVFKLSELQMISSESGSIGSNESCLGLVVVDRCFMRFGLDETYTFLHLTFQEYLAAVYMAGLSHSEQICIIEQHYELQRKSKTIQKNMKVVYRFLCGMLNFELSDSMEVFKVMQSGPEVPVDTLVQWAHESQSHIPLVYILCQCWHSCTDLNILIDQFDSSVIATYLNNRNAYTAVSVCLITKLNDPTSYKDRIIAVFSLVDNKALTLTIKVAVSECYEVTFMENVQMLQQYCETKVGSVTVSVNTEMSRIPYKVLKSYLKHQSYQFRFELNGKELGNEAVQYIKICITNSDEIRPLKVFDDVTISVSDSGCHEFVCTKTIYELSSYELRSFLELSPEDYAARCPPSTNLQYPHKWHNVHKIRLYNYRWQISESDTLTLIGNFKYCTNLLLIDLGRMQLKFSAVYALGQYLKHSCSNVQVLMVDDNEIGDAGLQALMPGIQSCVHLKQLILHNTKLTDDSVPNLMNVIQTNKNLKRLGCRWNAFTQVGKSKLKEAMLEAEVKLVIDCS